MENIVQRLKKMGLDDVEVASHQSGLHAKWGDYTLSLQWHWGNYCANRTSVFSVTDWKTPAPLTVDFEMAVFGADGNLIEFAGTGDSVLGWVSWDRLEEIVGLLKAEKFADMPRVCK
jgi:hypothetical protein